MNIGKRNVRLTILSFKKRGLEPPLLPSAVTTTALLLILILSIAPIALAQQATGTISGYVLDRSGAAIVNTTVTAVMIEQNTKRTVQTDEQGFYNFLAMPADHYTIIFEAKGFSRVIQSNVELTISQHARVDAKLSVGAVTSALANGNAPVAPHAGGVD